MPIIIPPRPGHNAPPASEVAKPKIIIPPRGTKAAPIEKRKPVLPGVAVQRAAVDSSAFNRSVLPGMDAIRKAVPNLPERRLIMPLPEMKLTGLTITMRELMEMYPLPLTPMGEKFSPYDWQIEDIETLIQWSRVGIFLPVGAGKTLIMTYLAFAWNKQFNIVLLPPILVGQWVKWLNSIKNSGGAIGYKGTLKARAAMDLTAHRWWVMSYGIFKNDYNKLLKLLHGHEYATLFDEAQNLKNTESQLHNKVARFSAGHELALATGTELNDPSDAYAYVKIKTPGIYRSYGHFTDVHVGSRDFFDKPTEWVNLEIMNRNLYLQSVQRTKEEVHSHLPKARYMPFEYELSDKHNKLYHELGEQQLLLLLDGGKVDATSTQNLYNHMQQIVNNPHQYGLEERPASFDVIDSLIEQLDFGTEKGPKKFIIWTWYKQTTKLIAAYLETLYPGRVARAFSETNSDKEFTRFLEDPDCWWIVAQPLSAGAGVNPQYVCYNCLYVETPTRTIPFRQSAGRIDREGQRENANIWIGIAKGTIQETLYQNLLTNDELVQKVQKNPTDIRKMIYGGS